VERRSSQSTGRSQPWTVSDQVAATGIGAALPLIKGVTRPSVEQPATPSRAMATKAIDERMRH